MARDDEEDDRASARLWVAADLTEDGPVPLDADQAHYLRSVLRLAPGAELALFNGRDGEWLGRIATLAKQSGTVTALRRMRAQTADPDLWLVFAPVKRARIDFLVEKAVELGAARLLPVFTRHTAMTRVNLDRLQAHAREAAEQTERLSVPEVALPETLEKLLDRWDPARRLILCDETGTAPDIAAVIAAAEPCAGGWAVLIGPEGGFATEELDRLRKLPFVTPVGLGPRILRSDTAALAALAVFQALLGDWSRGRGPAIH
jgi:16S rRNA (uracil1498-N3)-methyltransferase